MADTTFVNGTTLTDADWFNDVNRLHYTILSDPADVAAVKTALAIAAAAAQSDQETGTSTTAYVSPGKQQFHPSAAKVWGYADYSGGIPTLRASYNVSGIVDNGVGDIEFTISTDMSSGTFSSGGSVEDVNPGRYAQTYNNTNSTYIRVLVTDSGATPQDPTAVSAWAFGDQA